MPLRRNHIVMGNVCTAGTLEAAGPASPPAPALLPLRGWADRVFPEPAGPGRSRRPAPQGSGALDPFAEGASPGRSLRPSSDRVAASPEPPGSPHTCSLSHLGAPPRVPSPRPESWAPARPWGQKGDRGARRSRTGR